MTSQITNASIVCSTVCSGVNQRKHQISAPLAFLMEIHQWPLDSPHKWPVMPQSHPTTGPVRFSSPVRFLARKAEWSARRNFTSVLFPWSHQATGHVRLDTAAYLWFGWIIRRTPRVPRAMPVRASYGPRTGIFIVFHILRGPYEARAWPARVPYGALTGM